MLTLDPRSISNKVYSNLNQLKGKTSLSADRKEQKGQAVELYNYLATWGLLRLKAEEITLRSKPQKQAVINYFFQTLEEIAFQSNESNSSSSPKKSITVDFLSSQEPSEYLGLTGLSLQIAREFAFWSQAVYPED